MPRLVRIATYAVATSLLATSLTACFPLAATGIVAGAFALADRRSVAAQADDQTIEVKARSRIRGELGSPEEIDVTSFNRRVLLTGRVLDDTARQRAEQIVRAVPDVAQVHNEIAIGPLDTVSGAQDALLTTKVKAAIATNGEVEANLVKVVTENTVVYLMGLVTQKEGRGAAEAASRVAGVSRVVTLYEYLTDAEVSKLIGSKRTPQ